MITRAEAVSLHAALGHLFDLQKAAWSFIHRHDDAGLDQIDAFRTWPSGHLDAISVRSPTDARGLRTITDEHGIVWERAGTVCEVVREIMALPEPGDSRAPRLVLGKAPRLWTP